MENTFKIDGKDYNLLITEDSVGNVVYYFPQKLTTISTDYQLFKVYFESSKYTKINSTRTLKKTENGQWMMISMVPENKEELVLQKIKMGKDISLIKNETLISNNDTYQTFFSIKEVYQGGFINGNRSGYGEFIDTDGNKYIGTWTKNKLNVNDVKVEYKNGNIYKGSLNNNNNNLANGKGVVLYADKTTYNGQLENGIRHGEGKFIDIKGNAYNGTWNNDQLDEKMVTVEYKNSGKYEGPLKNGVRHGKGSFTGKSGDLYKGTWNNDQLEERNVTVKIDEKSKDEGKILNDKKDEIIQQIIEKDENTVEVKYTDGSSYVGGWFDNQKNGLGTYTDAKGNKSEGVWAYDELKNVDWIF
jgi:hypothetical protein